MKRHLMTLLAALIATPGLAAAADSTAANFSDAQQQAIGKIAADYIIAHPEVLVQASQKLQAQQQQQQTNDALNAVLANVPALLQDQDTPSYGPKDAKVALVEFFDYQCLYCSHMAPVVAQTIKANSDVRFVFKEWPIFGDRWKASITAAENGLAIWKQKGAQAYLDYHNAIYATGHDEGKLTDADISAAVESAHGALPSQAHRQETHAALAKNDELAKTLGFQGTPGFIVMPVSGANASNTTVLPGAVSAEELQAAISKAQGK
ncbi:MAG: DsbA family protein [Rouxiella aceris]|uniref:DsbA family protein n=1 Tax=Rouxiella aceris TaxID=2703884 RepID=UPI00283EC2D8|nr:DsbA family protein [Rouxiella aceris]MDR3433338.1 DsbA family protein [Rouxiella aceris]